MSKSCILMTCDVDWARCGVMVGSAEIEMMIGLSIMNVWDVGCFAKHNHASWNIPGHPSPLLTVAGHACHILSHPIPSHLNPRLHAYQPSSNIDSTVASKPLPRIPIVVCHHPGFPTQFRPVGCPVWGGQPSLGFRNGPRRRY